MPKIETQLAEVVLDVLRHRQPCRASVIAGALQEHGNLQITRRDINRLLYGCLNDRVEQDESYRWHLRESETADDRMHYGAAVPVVNHPAESAASSASEARALWLRVIERIRTGLPAVEGVDQLTVGYGSVRQLVGEVLDPAIRPSRWLFVKGDYGAGKTHFLNFLRCRAHSAGYATCYLCTDSANNALNHPQRFLHGLLATLEFPAGSPVGMESLTHEAVLTPFRRDRIRRSCSSHAATSRMPFNQILEDLELLDRLEDEDSRDGASRAEFRITEALSGLTITCRSANDATRDTAYCLLRIAVDLVQEQGCKGVVFLIDEAESIFTKLPSIASRRGAFRVLSGLCEGPLFDDCVFALAVTPDAYSRLWHEMEVLPVYQRLSSERMEQFKAKLVGNHVPVIECPSLTDSQLPELVQAVRQVYSLAYPDWRSDTTASLNSFADGIRLNGVPFRVLVRQVVDHLDALRFESMPQIH